MQAEAYRRGVILQSQLHRVNGRNASGDLTIKPLSSTVEDLGMKNGPACSKVCGDSATLKHTFISIEQEVRAQSTRTPVQTIWNTIWSTSVGILSLYQSFRQTSACQFLN